MTDELPDILRRAGAEVVPTDAELDRIRAGMFSGSDAEPTNAQDSTVVELPELPVGRSATASRRPRILAAAAAVVVLGTIAGMLTLRQSDNDDAIAAAAPPPGACLAIEQLDDAITAWRTVRAWATVGVSDPDLGARTVDALRAISAGEGDPATEAADELAALLERSALAPGEFVTERETAVLAGIDLLIERLEPFTGETACDLDLLIDTGR